MSSDMIIVMAVIAFCAIGLTVSSMNNAIETHQKGRYTAAMDIIDYGINQEMANIFGHHDAWLEAHANSWWIKFTDREKYGDNIALRNGIVKTAADMVTVFKVRGLPTQKYNSI